MIFTQLCLFIGSINDAQKYQCLLTHVCIMNLLLVWMQTNTQHSIFTTSHSNEFVYLPITFDIHIYISKQSKRETTSINKPNGEIFNVIGAVVIDIHQRTQTAKTLLFIKCSNETGIEKIAKQRFLQFVFVDLYQ